MSSEMFSELRNAIAKIVDVPENEWVFLTKYLKSITLRKKEHMIRQFKFEVHHCLMYENRIPRKEFDSQVIFSVDY